MMLGSRWEVGQCKEHVKENHISDIIKTRGNKDSEKSYWYLRDLLALSLVRKIIWKNDTYSISVQYKNSCWSLFLTSLSNPIIRHMCWGLQSSAPIQSLLLQSSGQQHYWLIFLKTTSSWSCLKHYKFAPVEETTISSFWPGDLKVQNITTSCSCTEKLLLVSSRLHSPATV